MSSLPLLLARARLGRNRLKTLSLAIALALALTALLALQGISYSTSNSLVSYSLSELAPGDRTLTVTSNEVIYSAPKFADIDRYLAKQLSRVSTGAAIREFLYHEIADPHGNGFYLGGLENLSHSLTLTSGRMPATCTPNHCEVVQVGGISSPFPESLGLYIVGKGEFKDSQLFSGPMSVDKGTPLLVIDGLSKATSLTHFSNIQGSDAWVKQANLEEIAKYGASTYVASVLAFENNLSLAHPELKLSWPQDALTSATDQATSIADRFTLLDLATAALLMAFLLFFSLRYRKDQERFRAGLSRIGTPKKTIGRELKIESALPVCLGVLASVAVSLALPSLLHAFGFHAGLADIYKGAGKAMILALLAACVIIGASVSEDIDWRRLYWSVNAIASLLIVFFLYLGEVQDKRLWLIPFIFVLLPEFSRLLLISLRAASALWRKRQHATFVLFREELSTWQGVAAILTLTSILAVLALSFDSGIRANVNEKSQDQVPLAVSIRTGPSLVRPLTLGGSEDYASLLSGSHAFPILRAGTSVRSQGLQADSLTLLGVPEAAMQFLKNGGLRADAKFLRADGASVRQGIALGSAKTLSVNLRNIPSQIDLFAWFETPTGMHTSARLTGSATVRTLSLSTSIPPGSTLVAFEMRETSDYLSRRLHAMGEGSFAVPMIKGVGSLTEVQLDGRKQSVSNALWGNLNFPYAFDGGSVYLHPPLWNGVPNVVADPETAKLAAHGLLTISGAGRDYIQVRVAAVANAFPSAGSRFVIMNLQKLQSEFAREDFGIIDPIELWIATPNPPVYIHNFEASRFQGLVVQSQQEIRGELSRVPSNVGLGGAYRITFFFSLLLSLFMYLSALPLIYRERAGVLLQLETTGILPSQLRRALKSSLRLTVLTGALVGGVIGLAIGRFFISDSIPFAYLVITFAAAFVLSEVSAYLITRRFFTEATMVGGAQ